MWTMLGMDVHPHGVESCLKGNRDYYVQKQGLFVVAGSSWDGTRSVDAKTQAYLSLVSLIQTQLVSVLIFSQDSSLVSPCQFLLTWALRASLSMRAETSLLHGLGCLPGIQRVQWT